MFRTVRYVLLAIGVVMPLAGSAKAQPGRVGPHMAADNLRRGLESVVRAASQSQSQSAPTSPLVDRETAKGMSYDNQIKYTNTYFQKRQLNQMYRESERRPRHSQADYARYARDRAPDRLTSSQLDSFAGRINWPVVLRSDMYKDNRVRLESLYARHTAGGGGINTPEYAEIQQLTKALQSQLRGDIKNTTTEQYMYARKFLESLRYEARYPAGA